MSRTSYDRYVHIAFSWRKLKLSNRYLTIFSPEGRLYQVGEDSLIPFANCSRSHCIFRICLQSYLWFWAYLSRRQRQRYLSSDNPTQGSCTYSRSTTKNLISWTLFLIGQTPWCINSNPSVQCNTNHRLRNDGVTGYILQSFRVKNVNVANSPLQRTQEHKSPALAQKLRNSDTNLATKLHLTLLHVDWPILIKCTLNELPWGPWESVGPLHFVALKEWQNLPFVMDSHDRNRDRPWIWASNL